MKGIFLLLAVLFLSSCMTPYQPKGLTGGYTDSYLGDDIYLITVRVNAYTDETTAYEYFHRRANEIVKANGYLRYEVLDFGTSKKKGLVYFDDKPQIIQKPRVYGRIKCYRETSAPKEDKVK